MKPFEETIPNLDLLTIFMESVDPPPKVGFHLVYRHMHSLGKGGIDKIKQRYLEGKEVTKALHLE